MGDSPNPFGTTVLLQRDYMIGAIIIWSGLVSAIPTNWQLCDGTNGTPDLRARFIRGAWDDPSVGSTGGKNTHTHDFTGDGHVHGQSGAAILATGAGQPERKASASAVGTTDSEDNRPEFHTLAYIQRIS